MKLALPALVGFVVFGCTHHAPQPSVLVIGVERLGFEVASCGADPYASHELPGFGTFCEESVRFTHAYTTSTMSQAAWASLLTALYPLQHNVHNNGHDFLSPRFETVPELAVASGYHTGFFSGGPPIFRKSGLSQGFEIFDDAMDVQRHKPYRPVRETLDHFLLWLAEDVEDEPFFAGVHLADLQFPDVNTVSDTGELRERSFASQVNTIGEALDALSVRMKKLHRWDDTTVFLVGLNGPGSVAELSRQSTQVALFIKPVRRAGQEPSAWKIDRSVSLADLGRTFFDLMDLKPAPLPAPKGIETVSLANVLETPDVDWPEERPLVAEAGFTEWRGLGPVRASVRQDPYLFVFDVKPKVYNTFVDRLEVQPFPASDPHTVEQVEHYRRLMTQWGYRPYTANAAVQNLLEQQTSLDAPELERQGFWGLAARAALPAHDWKALERLGQKAGQPLWQYVARRNKNEAMSLPLKGCEQLFNAAPPEAKRDCADRLFIHLHSWVHEHAEAEKKIYQERFLAGYLRELTRLRVGHLNAMHLMPWDAELATEPSLSELFLYLPDNKMYLAIAKSRALKEDGTLDLRSPFEF